MGFRIIGAALPKAVLCSVFLFLVSGCSLLQEFQPAVAIEPIPPSEYIRHQRGDVLATGKLSGPTTQALQVTGLDIGACKSSQDPACIPGLEAASGLSSERRLAALAELALQRAIPTTEAHASVTPAQAIDLWMDVARYAYAYLFFTDKSSQDRAFEDRQTQVRDWYNYAVQQTLLALFAEMNRSATVVTAGQQRVAVGDWNILFDIKVRLPGDRGMPNELLPASSLSFKGVRNTYRRDGLGAELVALVDSTPVVLTSSTDAATPPPPNNPRAATRTPMWSEMPSPNITALVHFNGGDLDSVLRSQDVRISVHDPLVESEVPVNGQLVPLAGNFTAGYGVWLANSGFNRQSLLSLFGREQGIAQPHLYMMQPFDPKRRIILLIHGLASSPEAWVNVANEVLSDDSLRSEYQVWQMYYPTNMPVLVNHLAIRELLTDALHQLDPHGNSRAAQGIVVIGHSMGGLISRLLISSSGDQLLDWARDKQGIAPELLSQTSPSLRPMLDFKPFPGVERAIFIASPHRGTSVAAGGLAHWVSGFIRLPITLLEGLDGKLQAQTGKSSDGVSRLVAAVPNSIDNLSEHDSFVIAASDLPINPDVCYHSIIARRSPDGSLANTDDGLVPYASSHLAGAESEKIIVSGHSVQQSAAAIIEIRRILHEDIEDYRRHPQRHNVVCAPPAQAASSDAKLGGLAPAAAPGQITPLRGVAARLSP
ncbi:esterase/lipase family protein [Bordetella genomosp. 12]|uniref:esterase/lipase family protein n=1 Tax=Bordetella genomosp. 12 TaxID=463035 RepID=UPI0011777333|nr:alpha/beta fold hydrolase [Bordetella genomosp. 12]